MSLLHEFTDVLIKDLDDKCASWTRELIKHDASKHDRFCGRILAYTEIQSIIRETVKRWSMRDEQED